MNSIGQKAMVKSIEILGDLLVKTIIPNKCQNERYLHHYYSNEIQKFFKIDFENLENSQLHPEWPTSKKSKEFSSSKYKKNKRGKYIVVDNGSSGFIDFAIGNYMKPEFAIEFTSKNGFGSEDLIFDFLKLLDSANPFDFAISFNLIYRGKGLPQSGRKENIISALNNTLAEIIIEDRKLKVAENRQILFWIIEIDEGNKRSWVCENINHGFVEKLPDFQKYKT